MLRWRRKGGVGDGACSIAGDTVVSMATINPEMSRSVARWLSGAGPSVSATQARAVVDQLHSQARRAPEIVADVTGLSEAAAAAQEIPVFVVDRAGWAKAAADSAGGLLGPALAAGTGKLADFCGSVELALGASVLAARVLGQYDPLAKRLLLVAPNAAAFAAKYSLDRRDLSLWISVHELTHAAQFAAAPWIVDYLVSRLRSLLEQDDVDLESGSAAEAMSMMSLLEGHAEFVMNAVPLSLMPSKRRLVSSMERRRAAKNPLKSVLSKAFGLDLKAAQYRRGSAFVGAVVDAVGHAGFNKVWENPLHAPTPEEIDAPSAWIQRVGV